MDDLIYSLSGYPCLLSILLFTSSEIAPRVGALNKYNFLGNYNRISCLCCKVVKCPDVILMYISISRGVTSVTIPHRCVINSYLSIYTESCIRKGTFQKHIDCISTGMLQRCRPPRLPLSLLDEGPRKAAWVVTNTEALILVCEAVNALVLGSSGGILLFSR